MDDMQQTRWVRIHPLTVRITHWVNVVAIVITVLGGWLSGALLWNFAAMWLLAINIQVYLAYGFISGHLRRKTWPFTASRVLRDILDAFRGRLSHADLSVYNAAYASLILSNLLPSGLSIWKPVQLQDVAWLMGDEVTDSDQSGIQTSKVYSGDHCHQPLSGRYLGRSRL